MSTLAQAIVRTRQMIGEPLGSMSITSYSTGTVTVSADPTVTGSGTSWLTNIKPGETFHITSGQYYNIIEVTDDTHIELDKSYGETAGAGKSYTVTAGSTPTGIVVQSIVDAQREIVADIEEMNNTYFATSGPISYVSGTETYALPTTNGVVRKVLFVNRTDLSNNKEIHPIAFQDRNRYIGTTAANSTDGADEFYYLLGANIGIMPIPRTSASDNVTIHYLPEVTDPTLDTSVLSIPETCFELLCAKAAIKHSDNAELHQRHAILEAKMRMNFQGGRNKHESRLVRDNYESDY